MQDNSKIYYMVLDEKSTGPFTLDEVTLHPLLTPETLVWKPGLDNWVAAKTLPEFAPAFISQEPYNQTPPDYNNPHQGPYNQFADNPQYQKDHVYNNPNSFNQGYQNRYDHQHHYNDYQDGNYRYNNNRYRNDYRPAFRTNWLPWAIVATVLGFFTSCIGAIFGIIGIVQANKANSLYAQGFEAEGNAANSNARTMTIIGLIFAGLGIIFAFAFGNYFASFITPY